MASGNNYLIDDGIIVWFDGPEWDQVGYEAFNDLANELASKAGDNAPWEDRTGDARAGLEAKADLVGGDLVLTLYHTVEYGLWLEVIQNGNFATIMPTLEREAPRIIAQATERIVNARQGNNF